MSPLLSIAVESVNRLGCEAVLVLPPAMMDWSGLRALADAAPIPLLVAPASLRHVEAARNAGLMVLEVEPTESAIQERIILALLEAISLDLLKAGAQVVAVYDGFDSDSLDSMTVIRLGEHLERFTARDLRALETTVPLETLKAVIDVAVEIGREGREGKEVGTLIVVGDARNVLKRSRSLVFDPFKGYRRKDRNLRDPKVREAIKEIAQLDGGFIVSRDGTVESACRLIDAPFTGLSLPKGLGTRHWAGAAITKVTHSIAVVVSQSTGVVRLFKQGEMILRIAPMPRARALRWNNPDSSHSDD
ncbi:DNA integrity scanning protein DisA nucleotide-binding domain protein [Isosphaera pallida]|uniref:DNA integrity scanning protein DisA nucleotide-binding domain protein n=1 Tax=Isosphaera pallida TaxID=128 RepID=UPI0035D02835